MFRWESTLLNYYDIRVATSTPPDTIVVMNQITRLSAPLLWWLKEDTAFTCNKWPSKRKRSEVFIQSLTIAQHYVIVHVREHQAQSRKQSHFTQKDQLDSMDCYASSPYITKPCREEPR